MLNVSRKFIFISFCVMYLFQFLYIKYFELGLDMSSFNENQQNRYNDASLFHNKSNQSGRRSLVEIYEIQIVVTNISMNLKINQHRFLFHVQVSNMLRQMFFIRYEFFQRYYYFWFSCMFILLSGQGSQVPSQDIFDLLISHPILTSGKF